MEKVRSHRVTLLRQRNQQTQKQREHQNLQFLLQKQLQKVDFLELQTVHKTSSVNEQNRTVFSENSMRSKNITSKINQKVFEDASDVQMQNVRRIFPDNNRSHHLEDQRLPQLRLECGVLDSLTLWSNSRVTDIVRSALQYSTSLQADTIAAGEDGGSGKGRSRRRTYSGARRAQAVSRRNARERRRIEAVNKAFMSLRGSLPLTVLQGRNLSKAKTLQRAIEYIRYLKNLLGKEVLNEISDNSECSDNANCCDEINKNDENLSKGDLISEMSDDTPTRENKLPNDLNALISEDSGKLESYIVKQPKVGTKLDGDYLTHSETLKQFDGDNISGLNDDQDDDFDYYDTAIEGNGVNLADITYDKNLKLSQNFDSSTTFVGDSISMRNHLISQNFFDTSKFQTFIEEMNEREFLQDFDANSHTPLLEITPNFEESSYQSLLPKIPTIFQSNEDIIQRAEAVLDNHLTSLDSREISEVFHSDADEGLAAFDAADFSLEALKSTFSSSEALLNGSLITRFNFDYLKNSENALPFETNETLDPRICQNLIGDNFPSKVQNESNLEHSNVNLFLQYQNDLSFNYSDDITRLDYADVSTTDSAIMFYHNNYSIIDPAHDLDLRNFNGENSYLATLLDKSEFMSSNEDEFQDFDNDTQNAPWNLPQVVLQSLPYTQNCMPLAENLRGDFAFDVPFCRDVENYEGFHETTELSLLQERIANWPDVNFQQTDKTFQNSVISENFPLMSTFVSATPSCVVHHKTSDEL